MKEPSITKTIQDVKEVKSIMGQTNIYLSAILSQYKADRQLEIDEAFKKGHEKGFIEGYEKADKAGAKFYDDGYQRGLKDAWEAAGRVGKMNADEMYAIFGTAFYKEVIITFSASKAIEKLEAYEEKQADQNDIKVGDEVEVIISGNRYLIVWNDGKNLRGIERDGVSCRLQPSDIRKTGRHFDIEGILEAMRHE